MHYIEECYHDNQPRGQKNVCAYCDVQITWEVVDDTTNEVLGFFKTEDIAADFIATQPEADTGRYGLISLSLDEAKTLDAWPSA